MYVVSGLVSGNDVFARSSVAQLTVLSAAEGKDWDGCQSLKEYGYCTLTSSLFRQNDAESDSGGSLDHPSATKSTLHLVPGCNFRARRESALSEVVGSC